ncbi:hypothetical protein PF005_g8870 [Phytophthora fragariae]|uniref:Uncharacterized protein n=1 Tax=Phytophthora fragariae TaxID=53985 RepID=A0A6A3L9B9_9STRA|nr:hypothetical protein PF011_g8063 [Phytophthora fragariae]KAE9216888.1 hypothetical protein PF005_g8870 [Phytophthora fragariae]
MQLMRRRRKQRWDGDVVCQNCHAAAGRSGAHGGVRPPLSPPEKDVGASNTSGVRSDGSASSCDDICLRTIDEIDLNAGGLGLGGTK